MIQKSIVKESVLQKIKRTWDKDQSFLFNIVELMILFDLFAHKGKFQEGDLVRYNWKAKVQIRSAIEGNLDTTLIVKKVSEKGSSVYFVNGKHYGDGCDGFWLRKAYWWEI